MFNLERPAWHYGAIVGLVALPSVAGMLAHCAITGTRVVEPCPKEVARGEADSCSEVGFDVGRDACCVPTDTGVDHTCARDPAADGAACARR